MGHCPVGRFIPACAGNSALLNAVPDGTSVHPRLRGELAISVISLRSRYGSSPLTRGTRTLHRQRLLPIRFIPAYAGNSVLSDILREPVTVHPRLRGELIIAHNTRTSAIGSSPLTRGTPRSRMTTIICLRFIPAYAGNSESHPAFVSSTAVHPRLRGELMNFDFVHHYFSGSSPLTRGTHLKTV